MSVVSVVRDHPVVEQFSTTWYEYLYRLRDTKYYKYKIQIYFCSSLDFGANENSEPVKSTIVRKHKRHAM